MKYIVFSINIIENVFRFRNECSDGKLTKQHLKTLFEKVFPDGIQSKMNAQFKSPRAVRACFLVGAIYASVPS